MRIGAGEPDRVGFQAVGARIQKITALGAIKPCSFGGQASADRHPVEHNVEQRNQPCRADQSGNVGEPGQGVAIGGEGRVQLVGVVGDKDRAAGCRGENGTDENTVKPE